jgi:adenylate kinase family enzyme
MAYERVVVVGKSGAGKSTLAIQLAKKFHLQNIELDAFSWQANWTQISKTEMREKIDPALPPDGHWVADGNYIRVIQDIVWQRADTLIWLDYPFYIALWRVFKRTINRIWTGRELWNGNRETLWHHLSSWNPDENLFVWCWRMHWQHRRDFPMFLKKPEHQHLRVLRFRHPSETEEWLRRL